MFRLPEILPEILRAMLVVSLPVLATPAAAQEEPLPQSRMIVTMDQDFAGTDLSQMFDTTFEACRRACEEDDACTAFTFNTRANSCFPKSAVTGTASYRGARSARLLPIGEAERAAARDRADEIGFLGSAGIASARRLAREIGWIHPAGQYGIDDMLAAVRERRADGRTADAMRWMGGAVAASDAADQWAEYARLLIAAAPEAGENRQRYITRALPAATNAYLRATTDPARVNALTVLAEALEANDRGRGMIPALRLAERLHPREEITAALDDAIARYGFRIREHRVESDLADPRICAEFTEPLVRAGVNYADYLRLPDRTMAVETSGNRICIRGATHGERYAVTFREGLPSRTGEALAKDVSLRFYVRDRSPQVTFPGRAYVLPAAGDAALPVETVNLDTLDLTLYRVADRNLLRAIQNRYFGGRLTRWEMNDFAGDVAEEVWQGRAETGNELNRTMTTRLPLGEVLAGREPGAYALVASVPGEEDGGDAFQWFILTDLGLTTMQGNDGLHVFLRALGDAQPREGVELTLLGRANRVLGTTTTDAEGYARFEPGLTRGTGGAAPALITARQGDDLAFLSLSDPAFDLSDRGVAGRAPAQPIDVFLTTDRGAYRAGETIHATVLARDAGARAIGGLPVTAILTRPDGVEYARLTSSRDAAGGHVFELPLGQSVPRGSWRIEIKADTDRPPLASATVLAEDFLPERIDVDLDLPEGPLPAGSLPPLDVQADYLFGAPGADLGIEGTVRLSLARRLETFPGYVFGRHDAPAYARTTRIDGTTDAQGRAQLALEPDFPDEAAGTPFDLTAVVGVAEGSGRPVERSLSRVVGPDSPVIGIRPLFDGVIDEGATAAFDLIALNAELAPEPMEVAWRVNRVVTRYQWYQQYGNWKWEPYTTRTEVASGSATLGADPVEVSAPTGWGRYEIVVERTDGPFVAASEAFSAGWFAPADATTTPDMLELSLNEPRYAVGDTARLRLVPRHAGKAIVTVVSDRLIDMKTVDVAQGPNYVELPVTEDWGAGAYVTASVIRPMQVEAGQMPARALGLSHAPVDPGDKALAVRIDAPDEAEPRGPVAATVKVGGVRPGETAFVTVAAVDVGILNMTGFETPDPGAHYFGQRRLGMDIRDLYGRLIDSTQGAMGRVRSGGDTGAGAGLQSPPPTEDLVAYFTGPVTVGANGEAEVNFDLPDFNGTLRLMAVAWSETGVGAAEAEVLVRDPIVVTASLPRFLQPGDRSSMLLEIVHASGPAGRVGLDVTARGVALAAATPSGFDLAEKQKQVLRLPLAADSVGDHAVTVSVTTPDGRLLTKRLTLPVRRNDPEVATTQRFSLGAGDTFTLDENVFAGYRPGSGEAFISAGPLARFDAPALLASLNRYPYGCTEQVTSKAMPLLYLSSVAEAMGLAGPAQIDARIDQSIERILTRQAPNGAFGLWRAQAGDFWLDAYVTDFLSRARAEGHEVNPLAFRTALDNLRNRINYAPDFDADTDGGGEDIAYALMVLAREGAANMGDLRYYADVKGEDFATPLASAQLGAALAMYGDQTRADAMFSIASSQLAQRRTSPEGRVYRADYGTRLRDTAGVLSLAVEAGSTAIDRPTLVSRIVGRDGAMSTQESAWSLLAAKALVDDPSVSGLSVDGTPVPGPFVRAVGAGTLTPMAIRNDGATETAITLTTLGVPNAPITAGGYGYAIERAYFTMEGDRADPAEVAQGTRLVTVLTVRPFEETGARLMVDDPLPAGFEIDNPNLLRAGDIGALDWLDPAEAEHSEFRADRFLAAVDWRSDQPFRLAYVVRAITPGTYHHPAATVEDMYRPRYRARTDAGRVTVLE
ncbi:PAN domain protein [Pseudooceanicola batsensis HTCC2597]|uniref:PAN domain protein n=1 Tax=Pseudooceanicola batsensis (strain ATCC BAA-863 / DSM 15984 / KCTC 12145 / HTCC2597) TaxID=252305 RepID=A3U263_PSEBH|nr:alpha-2-macroglobulin family protein [Pseudooceanicola batsensis]EAQ01663.1 PAN domain protein [Pseudooceanicola batsensis HTCC2597]